MKVTGKGDFNGSRTLEFYITQKSLDDGNGKPAEGIYLPEQVYVEKGKKAEIPVDYESYELKAKDYTIEGNRNFTEDDTVSIVGKGNFTGEIKDVSVKVLEKADYQKAKLNVTLKSGLNCTYNGKPQTLKAGQNDEMFIFVKEGNAKTEVPEAGYSVRYYSNINAGTAKVVVTAKAPYAGRVTKTFKIRLDKNAQVTAALAAGEIPYVKNGAKPGVTVAAAGYGTLTEGKDYKVTYSNNKKVSTEKSKAKYKVTLLGNFKGGKAVTNPFDIVPASFGKATVSAGDLIYSKAGKYRSTPYVAVNGVQLEKKDYTVAYFKDGEELKGNLELADDETEALITVKVTGKGNYKDESAQGSYHVRRLPDGVINLASAKITASENMKKAVPAQAYTGAALTPAFDVYVKNGSGWELVDPKTYTASYINNVQKGTAVILVTGKGDKAAGSKAANFKISVHSMKGIQQIGVNLFRSLLSF